ncbi:DoxX family protein [Arthrobacter gengyunqii]|uniref:DoxX family protein n=1 Tax=Arthrobacter gengyunqii TaxID=2886940 RepID=A0A9X1M4F1_9MICC|nr:DoxX family protein [Arthrobacter gengyunqii]MCC3270737.1 DoxX family protein [Arthrobacter gengyunqii]UOY96651.1 DoxX family protein [Arthrobacter gengyunqii]
MSVFLWILQIVLALMFVGIGGLRLVSPAPRLRRLPWTDGYPLAAIRALGALELVAGLLVLVPGMLGWSPLLTAVAAGGLAVLMALAVLMHLRRGQQQSAVLPAILLVMAGIVLWGRLDQLL